MNDAPQVRKRNPYLSAREPERLALLAVRSAASKLGGRLGALTSEQLQQAIPDIVSALGPRVLEALAAEGLERDR